MPGFSDAYIGKAGNTRLLNGQWTTVMSVDLPAGYYVVFGKAGLFSHHNAKDFARCALQKTYRDDNTHVTLGANSTSADSLEVSLQGVAILGAPTTVTMICLAQNGFASPQLTALKVGELHLP